MEVPYPIYPPPEASIFQIANRVGPNTSVVAGNVTVGTTPTPLRVGSENLKGRRKLYLQGQTTGFKWGFTEASQPFDLPANEYTELDVGPEITIWAKKNSGSNTIAVAELA